MGHPEVGDCSRDIPTLVAARQMWATPDSGARSPHGCVVEIAAFADAANAVGAPVSVEEDMPNEASKNPHCERGEEEGDEFWDGCEAGHGALLSIRREGKGNIQR
jgi:hypothetical protein